MYRILTDEECTARSKLALGIAVLVGEQSKHPAVADLIKHVKAEHPAMLHRAIIAAALVYEPDFLQYMLDTNDTCSSTLSQYAVQVLPPFLDELLNGNVTLNDFVLNITHAYMIL